MATRGVWQGAVDRIGGEPVSARMARKAPIRHVDPTLLIATVALVAFGAVMILSATESKQLQAGLDPAFFLKRQIVYAAVASVVLVIASAVDYKHLRTAAAPLYVAGVAGLALVLTPLGTVTGGARRWFNLGFITAQPSEMAKLGVIVALAALLAHRKGEVRARDVALCIAAVLAPMALIYLEPDLGTMMIFAALTGALLLIGGAKVRHFLVLLVLAAGATLAVLQMGLLEDYQLERITAFMDPTPNVQSEGYSPFQAKIAIASGGVKGKGIQDRNSQTSLDFVPEQHTDFIFTAVGEQLGFMGSSVLIVLFGLLIWRALRIAAMSRDLFGSLIASGIAAMWAFQVFVNIGMTVGIMPITGIPLPFISFGGSSLLTNFACVGLLHNIHMRRFL
ncbi:MAG: rod shape-determining protein RodA [Actinomycetota bacterium]|nr:rod shape-determining protein RodA [Actinomycetota bacterium]